jgi:putative redox protein
MEIRLKRIEGMQFDCLSGEGHTVRIDGPPKIGGTDTGPRPMEMVLMGLAGCSAVDVLMILEKQRQEPADVEVVVTAERADAVPSVFTKVNVHFECTGGKVSQKKLERACDLSMTTYCSVSRMLEPTVEITHTCAVIEA